MSTDYIPRPDALFDKWQGNLNTKVAPAAPALNIPLDAVAALQAWRARWIAAYAAFSDPATHTKGTVKEKQEVRTGYEAEIRMFVRTYLTNNPALTDHQREDFGLPVHDTKPTPAPIPTDMPVGEVDFSTHQQHIVHVKAGTLTGKAKPPKVHGYEVWRKVGGDPPAIDSDWTYVNFSSRSPMHIDYPQSEVGTTVYYRFRWVNSRNQPGPWSKTPVSAVIA
jgi:hypothetical protein